MKKTAQGFTLIELLVVIAIIAILAGVVAMVINPLELMRRGRDSTRMSDLANVQTAINLTLQETTQAEPLCNGAVPPCDGTAGATGIDGSGWVQVNMVGISGVSITRLPVDPTNTGAYIYRYYSDGTDYELNAVLESQQFATKMSGDGGSEPNEYEMGTSMSFL